MRRLEAIADVRERAPDDHAHRVIHVRALHLVFDVDGKLLEVWGAHGQQEARRGTGDVMYARGPLDVQVGHLEGVVFDKLPPRLHPGRPSAS